MTTDGAVIRTLLVTDLVDSTRLVEKLGDARASTVLARVDRFARDLLEPSRGTEIDKTDGFLVVFERPIDAVRYATHFHEALDSLGAEIGIPIQARAGVHLGEVVLRENAAEDVARGAKPVELDGLAKHTAARVMSLALPGQTLLTRSAFEIAQRAAVGGEERLRNLKWMAHGAFVFKGIEEPMEVFEAGIEGYAPLAPPVDTDKARLAVVTPEEMAPGKTISHYKILERMAEGGMGVVYRAQDTRLKRIVALKFLRAQALQNSTIRERFMREARALALLDHPNICTVYEIDEIAQGPIRQTFIAMQYVGSRSLKDRILEGPLPIQDALNIAIQVGLGLGRSHAAGIVHRDIKPANIMLTEEQSPKIVDFGLARTIGPAADDSPLTRSETVAGTLLYMSPEQIDGKGVDHRTDLWSLGAVLYEMVTGVRPFGAEEIPALINAVLNRKPEPLGSLRADAPAGLESVVAKALAKSSGERYASASDMVDALRKVLEGSTPTAPDAEAGTETAIAVLPFRDMSPQGDQGYFCEGIAEEIINALTQVEGLRVASRGSSFQFSGEYDVREVGNRLNVTQVTEGSLRRAGNRLRITAQLTNTADGYQLWSQRFDRDADDIFEIQDEISMGILKRLKLEREGDRSPIRRYTDNIEAYNLYLRGRYYWNHRVPDAIRRSIETYRQALELDPNYALAYCGLADCYLVPGYYGSQKPAIVMPMAKSAAEKALAIDPDLVEAHTSLGMVASLYEFDWTRAADHFRFAIEHNPKYAIARMWHALFFLVPRNRLDEAVAEARRAQSLDPLTSTINTVVGACLFFDRKYEDATRELENAIEMDPNAVIAHYYLGRACWERGLRDRAVDEMVTARNIYNLPLIDGNLGYCYAALDQRDKAEEVLHEFERQAAEGYVPAASRAPVYVGLGQLESALDWLEKGFEERSFFLVWANADPLYQPLRSSPRFAAMMEKVGALR